MKTIIAIGIILYILKEDKRSFMETRIREGIASGIPFVPKYDTGKS